MATQEQIEALKIDENLFGLGENTGQNFECYKGGACHQSDRLPSSLF